MTTDEIIEGNNVFAKFMGYQILHKKFQYEHFNSSNESSFEWDEGDIVCDEKGREINLYHDGDPLFSFDELDFHTNWNRLMTVVAKIESLKYPVREKYSAVTFNRFRHEGFVYWTINGIVNYGDGKTSVRTIVSRHGLDEIDVLYKLISDFFILYYQ